MTINVHCALLPLFSPFWVYSGDMPKPPKIAPKTPYLTPKQVSQAIDRIYAKLDLIEAIIGDIRESMDIIDFSQDNASI